MTAPGDPKERLHVVKTLLRQGHPRWCRPWFRGVVLRYIVPISAGMLLARQLLFAH